MKSVWSDTSRLRAFEKLKKDIKTDVLIIGGGMTGLLCAHMLSRAGIDYILLEAEKICGGVTEDTTAKITSQHGLIYHKLIRRFGSEGARLYLGANEKALAQYRRLCAELNISCDFENTDSYVYALSDRRKLERELDALKLINARNKAVEFGLGETPGLPFATAGAVIFKNQAQFNPLKFISGIIDKLNIYENTPVRELKGMTAVCDEGVVEAKNIIVATHFPFLNKHGSYFIKLYQSRSYVIALDNAPDVRGMYVDRSEKGISLRNYKDLLIIGGGSHRTGKKGGSWQELREFAQRYYPQLREKYYWAAQDCMSLDGVPYIGRYSKNTPGLYVASGYNKWGMTSSMAAALILTDMIRGINNPYEKLFSPSRSVLRPQLALNAAETTVNLLTPTAKRCPHLGCALKWNEAERTWDCPCHGSRFTEEGKLIDNPATADAPWKEVDENE